MNGPAKLRAMLLMRGSARTRVDDFNSEFGDISDCHVRFVGRNN